MSIYPFKELHRLERASEDVEVLDSVSSASSMWEEEALEKIHRFERESEDIEVSDSASSVSSMWEEEALEKIHRIEKESEEIEVLNNVSPAPSIPIWAQKQPNEILDHVKKYYTDHRRYLREKILLEQKISDKGRDYVVLITKILSYFIRIFVKGNSGNIVVVKKARRFSKISADQYVADMVKDFHEKVLKEV